MSERISSNASSQVSWSLRAGTIHETTELVTRAGGKGIAVPVDQADDASVAALFNRIAKGHGRLDILVNNAAKLVATPGCRLGDGEGDEVGRPSSLDFYVEHMAVIGGLLTVAGQTNPFCH
jgi:NAD(P)-dependent dehydrogenase (short-subunit alcohol dehydrogenase family)